MYREFVLGFLLAGALFWSAPVLAYTSPGSPSGHINDFAQVLSDETKRSLEQELTDFVATSSNEIAVVTVPDMGGDYIENYSVKLFEEWKIGKKDRDNGVLLLLSIEERRLRIEVGYGLEGALPDSVAQRILDDEMTPRLKQGDYDGAVTAGVRAIEAATRGEYAPDPSQTPRKIVNALFNDGWIVFVVAILLIQWLGAILARSKSWWAGGIIGSVAGLGIGFFFKLALLALLPIALLLGIFGLIFDLIVSRAYGSAKRVGITPPWWAGGPGNWGGGSGGGGFGGFGGGSSGGGGASGGW